MKYAHMVKVNVFCKPEDNEEKVLNKLLELFPFNLEKEKIKVNKLNAEAFNQKKIIIYEVQLQKDRHINEFISSMLKKLESEKKLLLREINSRLDNELNFFFRLDKDKLIKDSSYQLTDSGNCYHIKISIAAFPAKKEKALEVVKKLLK